MRSTEESRLFRLTEAIDELAAERLDDLPPQRWAERIADIWALIEGLDPEITLRRVRYSRPES